VFAKQVICHSATFPGLGEWTPTVLARIHRVLTIFRNRRLNFYENVLYVKALATNRASIRTLMSALALGAVWVSVRCGAAI
jgi:hypothetical protein